MKTRWSALALFACLLGCAAPARQKAAASEPQPSTAPVFAPSTPAPTPVASAPSPAPPDAAPAPEAPSAPDARPSVPDARPSEPEAAPLELEAERPHRLGERPRPEGAVQASIHDEELGRWNVGGCSDPSHPSSRAGFHPAVRVVIDTRLVDPLPRPSRRSILVRSRDRGYWPTRLCYEEALRSHDVGSGRVELRLDIGPDGAAARTVLQRIELEESAQGGHLAECLLDAFEGLRFRAFGRRVRVDVSVKLWPGDAPLPAVAPPAPESGSAEAEEPAASPDWAAIAESRRRRDAMAQFVETGLEATTTCFRAARADDPSLWGRLALWVDIDTQGGLRVREEHESRFPSKKALSCVSNALEGLTAPPAASEPEAWVIAFRLHKHPQSNP